MRVFLLALIVGSIAYGLGYWQGQRAHAPPSAAPITMPAAHLVEDAAREPPPTVLDVELIGAQTRQSATVTGIALGSEHRVVLALASMEGARAALAQTADGRVPLGPVTGVLPAARLVAVAGPEGGLPISPEPATLHLGLHVNALEHGRSIGGEVQSTGERREDGSYVYLVQLEQPLEAPFAALMDPGGAELIGAITAAGADPGIYEAVDAGALQTLAGSAMPALDLERFTAEFFTQQPSGRLISFEHAVAANDWTAAIALGEGLMNLGWSYRDAVSAPLADAYLEAARAAHAQPTVAIALLDEGALALGESSARLQERAVILRDMGLPLTALQALGDAMQLDPLVRDELRKQALAVAAQSSLSMDARIAALRDAAARDVAYAPYQAALGRLYHAQGRYVEAAASLENAMTLDPALEGELGDLLASARQRLRTPGETVAPLHASDGGLYVYANVGGRQMRFVLDTGATYTALSTQAAQSLGLGGFPDARTVMLTTAGGRVNAPLITLRAIDVNGAIVQQVPVVILDSTAPFDGLLGMSFLDHFDVSIDRGAGNMRLVRR